MRLVINQLEALKQKTGIGHYTDQLLRCLSAQVASGEVEVYPAGWAAQACRAMLARKARHDARSGGGAAAGEDVALLSHARHWLLQRIRSSSQAVLAGHFARTCAKRHYDLYHEPNTIPLPCHCPTVVTVHDLSLLLYPQWHPVGRVRYFEQHFFAGLERCSRILTVTESIRQEVIHTLGLAPERVSRVYIGIRRGLSPLAPAQVASELKRLGLPARYLLYLGTLEPRKNVGMLLRAYCGLPGEVRERWPLLLVGRWGWNAGDLWQQLHTEARYCGVHHLGYVAEEHLPILYGGARALLYPSHYEGFGLPPMEMMACGGAVIASTAAALVETVGSQAQLLPAEDIHGWREAILRVVRDDDWWHFLRAGAETVAEPFTWDRCAAETLAIYRQVVEGKTPSAETSTAPLRQAG